MSQPHQQTNGFSFQSSLKSQDDSSIKYEAFNDEDYNKEAHNIEKVILVIIVNISNIYKGWFLLIHVMEKISKILCFIDQNSWVLRTASNISSRQQQGRSCCCKSIDIIRLDVEGSV